MEGSGKQEVKLLGSWASPFTLRAKIALNLKKVHYEYQEEQYGLKSELLLKSNPVYRKIPVLIHDGKPVCESMIIVQYIDDVWGSSGRSLMPAEAYEQAMHRFWTAYIEFFGMADMGANMTSLQMLEAAFGKLSNGKPFFGGDTIGYLDIALGSLLRWIKAIEGWMEVIQGKYGLKLLDDTKTPLLCAWSENFCNSESVATVLPESMKLVELAKLRNPN